MFLDDAGIDITDWIPSDDEDEEAGGGRPKQRREKEEPAEEKDLSWALPLFSPLYREGLLENSSKMWVLKSIIDKCLQKGEKLLVFSMWTSVLDMMERFLRGHRHPLTRNQWLARCERAEQVRDFQLTRIPLFCVCESFASHRQKV